MEEVKEMDELQDMKQAAERFLDDMLKAEKDRDYEAWTQHYDGGPEGFSQEDFLESMDLDRMDLGDYVSREYLGDLDGYGDEYPNSRRFVWKGVFSKNQTLMVLGVHQVDGKYYVNENLYL